ncbi:DUF4062 domain-containing protein [Methanobrevibacter sp.]|uniref:DUF4062 domain-containing protein n=1 Tax=Methanobrevibacter sp. TaxID=66852 RepID=UPI0038654C1C
MENTDTWKDAIVFISSTFNDMHAERDYLVKEVFPELTEWCEKRHIRLTDIDLRWGVTEEDSSNSKTIETCLRHVDKSKPFFLCFLGQRRGWVPNFNKDISEETKKKYEMGHLKDRSATEMEIEHALLRPLEILIDEDEKEKGECRHSIFFFRNGEYAKKENNILSPKQRLIYTNDYLKQVAISKVMDELNESKDEQGKDLHDKILNEIKVEFANNGIEYPEFVSELIYDFQYNDCEFYNYLFDDLVRNPTKDNNLCIIAELKFKNPGLYKEITHDIRDNDEKLYEEVLDKLDNYQYRDIGIDQFYESFNEPIIKETIDEIKAKNEVEFNIHENELVEYAKKIKEKQSEANTANENLDDNKKIHVVINDYKGRWDEDLLLPELSHYKFGEGKGRLTDFECDNKPLKEVIISEFKKQFEMEFKDHIQKIANKNPEIYENEDSEIIKVQPSVDMSEDDKKLANELDQQENFCHNNSEGFVPRETYTNKLDAYVKSDDNKICLVSAEAGLGKTMLLAAFANNFYNVDDYKNKRLYKRFCGGSDLSSRTYSLWKSIIDEAGIDNKEIYPKNIVDLRRNINDILKEIAKDEDVVIVIDAINQMEDGMEMLNWFGELPENLKLIISVKEVNIEDTDDKSEEEIEKDIKYHDKLEIIKKKNTISDESSFVLDKLDHEKEKSIANIVNEITDYADGGDNGICVVNSDLTYDKSLIFHIFNDKYTGNVKNFRCSYNEKSACPSDKLKKSVSKFGRQKTIFDVCEISGNAESIKSKLESHISELSDDEIVIVDLMSNDSMLLKELNDIKYPSKTVIGVKKTDFTFNNVSKEIELNELDAEKNEIIKSYLSNYLKELDEREIHEICNFKGSTNPLFLKILLAELRVFGSFDQLKDEITSFGDSPFTAFTHVFERLEEDEKVRGDNLEIAKPLFSLLATSRDGGLSEEEIVTVLKDKYNLNEDDVRASVNLNLRQVRPFMARKEERHDFFYEKFREAARNKYADDYDDNIKLLTDYFRNKVNEDSKVARPYMELPYYLNESNETEELKKILSSYSFIKNKLYSSNDVYSLISDYNYLNLGDDEDHPLNLIKRALELSSPVLMNDSHELPTQFWGRMNEINDEKIKDLLDDLQSSEDMRIKPTSGILYSPKSSIIKRLLPDGNKSSSAIGFNDDNKILFGSSDGALSLYDIDANTFENLEKTDSNVAKIILKDGQLYVARGSGDIKRWNLTTRDTEDFPNINSESELKDIYVSDTYGKIYAVSHSGVYSIDLETKERRREDIDAKNYNQILVPRRNEAILVCDEREVDGWDVYEMRKAYNKHHQQNDEDDSSTKIDSSEEIRFMGLNKRFLTLISENGQMKFWNTLKNSGGGESIAEERVCSPNDKFMQAKTLEDENEIITISDMGVMRVWDIPQPASPQFDKVIDIQTGIKSPTAIDYHINDEHRWVIVGNENNDVSIIDLNKKVEADRNVRHAESVLSIKIDGSHMITASDNGEIFTWDLDNEEFINKYSNDFRCNSISYNREDSKLVFAGVKTDENDKKIYKIATCKITDEMWSPVETEENKAIELEIEDETINSEEIIDIAQNKSGVIFIEKDRLSTNQTKFDNVATTLATKFDSDEIFVGFEDGNVVKYPSGETFSQIASPVTKIRISGDKVIAGYENGSIVILDLDLSNPVKLDAHEKDITNLYVDESQLISLSKDNTIKFWDIDSKECKYTYYLDIFATSIGIKDDKLVVGDALGNVRFFEF